MADMVNGFLYVLLNCNSSLGLQKVQDNFLEMPYAITLFASGVLIQTWPSVAVVCVNVGVEFFSGISRR